MIKINGVDIPKYPSTFSVAISDLDDGTSTTRTMDGMLHRDRIAVKRKLELKFALLKWAELSTLLNQIQDVFFMVTYPDPMTGNVQTKEFYVGDRSAPVGLIRDGEYYWTGISFNFIER